MAVSSRFLVFTTALFLLLSMNDAFCSSGDPTSSFSRIPGLESTSRSISEVWDIWRINLLCITPEQNQKILQETSPLEKLNSTMEELFRKYSIDRLSLKTFRDEYAAGRFLQTSLLKDMNSFISAATPLEKQYNILCREIAVKIKQILTPDQLVLLCLDPAPSLTPQLFKLAIKIVGMNDADFARNRESLARELAEFGQNADDSLKPDMRLYTSIIENARQANTAWKGKNKVFHLLGQIFLQSYKRVKWTTDEKLLIYAEPAIINLFCRAGSQQMLLRFK